MKKLITYIFPIYNEELNIDKLYSEMIPVFDQIKDKYEIEIIFINDGSKDSSLAKLLQVRQKDPRFKIINFARNFGHQIAISAGLDYSKGDAVIIMDSDLQDPPTVSLELIQKWEEGYEVVYAQRRTRKDTVFKRLTAFLFYRTLDKLASIKIPKDTGDFRLMDRKVVDVIKQFRERNRFMRGMVASVGFKQVGVEFDRSERYAGKTNYPLKKMIKLAMDGIISFSTFPLKFISQIGIFSTILGLVLILGIIIQQIIFPQNGFSNWLTISSVIIFVSGIQVISIGILGNYIGRIYSEVLNRPLYIVSEFLD